MGICCMTQGTKTGAPDRLKGGMGRDGREVWEGGDMGIPMVDSY